MEDDLNLPADPKSCTVDGALCELSPPLVSLGEASVPTGVEGQADAHVHGQTGSRAREFSGGMITLWIKRFL